MASQAADLPAGGSPDLYVDLDERIGAVSADAVRVRQLLHNLIRNALEAMEGQTGSTLNISTRLLDDTDVETVEICVSDNGPGIDPDTLEQIFEPYVTTKQKGTGLGLAIVKKLVEEHGGTVFAENLPDRGARLRVRLPAHGPDKNTGGDTQIRRADYRRERA